MVRSLLLALGVSAAAIATVPVATASAGASETPTRFKVDSTVDEPDANLGDGICRSTPSGRCTLRAAVEEGQLNDTAVVLPKGEFKLTLGHLWVKPGGSLSLSGKSAKHTVIDGQFQWRVLDISHTGRAALSNVTLTGGAGGPSDAFPGHEHGGAIHNHGTFYLTNAAVWNNNAGKALNQYSGAGLTNAGTGVAHLMNVTFSDNILFNGGGKGGAIENLGQLHLEHVTIANNVAAEGGGIYQKVGSTNLYATLIANNSGYDCAGDFAAGTTITDQLSLESSTECKLSGPGSKQRADAKLVDFDLEQRVWILGKGSPAIDGATGSSAGADQTGRRRPLDGNGDGVAYCDIGAYEAPAMR